MMISLACEHYIRKVVFNNLTILITFGTWRCSLKAHCYSTKAFCCADDELKHPLTRTCLDAVSGKTGIQTDVETLELIWKRATEICNPSSLKSFLQRRGKLASVLLSSGNSSLTASWLLRKLSLALYSGIVVAELEFDHPDSVSKAEKSWKVIAAALQHTFGYNVELRINLMNNVRINYAKLKKPSFRLFSCSRRLNFRLQYCSECRSNASESSSYSVMTGDRSVETCTTDCASQDLHPFCCTKETVTTIRHSDGNALSIRATPPCRSLQDTELGHDPWNMKPGNQSRYLCALHSLYLWYNILMD